MIQKGKWKEHSVEVLNRTIQKIFNMFNQNEFNSPLKWFRNGDFRPGNRSKQFQKYTISAAKCKWKTACMHAWLYTQQVFYIKTLPHLLCEFLGTVWICCRGDSLHYIITSLTVFQKHELEQQSEMQIRISIYLVQKMKYLYDC